MMNRWTWFAICLVFGLLLVLTAWLMPVHMRAVEPALLQRAGQNSTSITGRGTELLHIGQFGAAELLLRTAQHHHLPGSGELATDIENSAKKNPSVEAWGVSGQGIKAYFPKAPVVTNADEPSFTDFVVHEDNRSKALQVLGNSHHASVQELLKTRSLTNTTTFAPSQMAGGEAFDTAVVITALFAEQNHLTGTLSNEIVVAANQANQGGHTEPLEQILLDFLSLGQRLNWGQLIAFVGKTDSADTLHNQADLLRGAGDQLSDLFSAVEISGNPKAVADYLKTFHDSGLKDIVAAFPYNAGGVRELLQSGNHLYASPLRVWAAEHEPFANILSGTAGFCWRTPLAALILKWLLFFAGGFLLALAAHWALPPVSALERPLQVRGFHVARELLFAFGFLLVVLLVSEPFLAPEHPTTAMPFRLRIPTVGSVVQPGASNANTIFMDKSKIIPMLLFFVLQGLLYLASITKLAEIRRQQVGPRIKLRLLENEEHLFDAGLYLGFLGTIVAFIIYSLYVKHQFDLMVAYSSTSFGILFVSFFKIFHLRPVRRKLLLEAEAESPTAPATRAAAPSLASS